MYKFVIFVLYKSIRTNIGNDHFCITKGYF